MNDERLEILDAIYREAVEYENMENNYLITSGDRLIYNWFDYQYLEQKGYIKLKEENGKHYAEITVFGVDTFEDIMQI